MKGAAGEFRVNGCHARDWRPQVRGEEEVVRSGTQGGGAGLVAHQSGREERVSTYFSHLRFCEPMSLYATLDLREARGLSSK
jgi:hypothetical protein